MINDFNHIKRYGDRFFYDLGNDLGESELHKDVKNTRRFTLDQLNETRKASMARILCDNSIGDITEMQPSAFSVVDDNFNSLKDCSDANAIPTLDLELFA